jgi:hypothetical protein
VPTISCPIEKFNVVAFVGRGRIASGLEVLECEAHNEVHIRAQDARLAYTGPVRLVPGSIFQPLIFVAILGWVGTNMFELWINDFRKKHETAPSAHLHRRGPGSPHHVLVFEGSRFACLHGRLLLSNPGFYCDQKPTRRPERSTTVEGWRRRAIAFEMSIGRGLKEELRQRPGKGRRRDLRRLET